VDREFGLSKAKPTPEGPVAKFKQEIRTKQGGTNATFAVRVIPSYKEM
jgi:hypothetical protein